jgi:hypothetical protein
VSAASLAAVQSVQRPRAFLLLGLALLLGLGAIYFFAVRSGALAPLAAPAAGATAPGVATRTVRVTVAPPDAAVELDGKAARVDGGALSIQGTLGSVHHVKLTVGSRSATIDVVIAESGAVPPRVELDAAP